jgi:hypothetical protein
MLLFLTQKLNFIEFLLEVDLNSMFLDFGKY